MSCITKQHIGKYTYLYESTSFRNADGKPRNKKVRIGKIDPDTGETIYTEDYLHRMETAGTPVVQEPLPPQIAGRAAELLDSVRRAGTFHLFRTLAEDIHLLPMLRSAFPKKFAEIFTLACFLAESREPLMYCDAWLSQTEAFPLVKLSSQRISELLSSISLRERNFFYQQWMEKVQEKKYVALDITSISSYSQLIHGCEWGYNRDHEDLPQINLCMLFGEGSRFPIYQTSYHGSLKDVSTLRATLDEAMALAPDSKLRVVMDKGFYSSRNVDEMLSPKRPIHFLIAVPFSSSFTRKLVASEQHSIDRLENTILTSGDAIRGVHKIRVWNTRSRHAKLHAHIYFNPAKAVRERNKLYAYVTELRQEALRDPGQSGLQDEFHKYLSIRKSSTAPNGHTVTIKDEIVEDKLRTCGWMVLLSDTVEDSQEALDIYRTKDVVEKGFDRLKNALDLDRLRVHNDERMENKLFLGFLALLLISALHQRMQDAGLYTKYSMHELLLKLSKIHIARFHGRTIMQPISKEQRILFEQLGLKPPVG